MKIFYSFLMMILFSQCRDKSKPENAANRAVTLTPLQDTARTNYFPFRLSEDDGKYDIVVELEGKELYPKYYDLFKKYGYEGNGPCWEGHIMQILEKLDPSIISHIEFDPEAGLFVAHANSKAAQHKFVEILSPIFSNLDTLASWVKKADRSKIDDW